MKLDWGLRGFSVELDLVIRFCMKSNWGLLGFSVKIYLGKSFMLIKEDLVLVIFFFFFQLGIGVLIEVHLVVGIF